jgi:hypothetical protein
MKRIILFITLLIFIINCFSLDTSSVKYLPLKIGNVWVYQYDQYWPSPGIEYRFKGIIDRDTIINGKRFFHNSGIPIFNIGLGIYYWLRFDSTNGNLYGISNQTCPSGSNVQIIDSLASVLNNYTYICHSPDTLVRQCQNVGLITFCNQQNTSKKFDQIGLVWSYSRTYIKNYGIYGAAYGELHPEIYTLLGCVLNGAVCGDTSLTGIIKNINTIPASFQLYQNYPNPFNPSSKIKFDIPNFSPPFTKGGQGGLTTLRIFDLLGREVATLVNERLSPGTYEVEWDGTNYPSGIYFYELKTNSYNETKRMVLIK